MNSRTSLKMGSVPLEATVCLVCAHCALWAPGYLGAVQRQRGAPSMNSRTSLKMGSVPLEATVCLVCAHCALWAPGYLGAVQRQRGAPSMNSRTSLKMGSVPLEAHRVLGLCSLYTVGTWLFGCCSAPVGRTQHELQDLAEDGVCALGGHGVLGLAPSLHLDAGGHGQHAPLVPALVLQVPALPGLHVQHPPLHHK